MHTVSGAMTVAQQPYVQDQIGVTHVLSLLAQLSKLHLNCCGVASIVAVQKP